MPPYPFLKLFNIKISDTASISFSLTANYQFRPVIVQMLNNFRYLVNSELESRGRSLHQGYELFSTTRENFGLKNKQKKNPPKNQKNKPTIISKMICKK